MALFSSSRLPRFAAARSWQPAPLLRVLSLTVLVCGCTAHLTGTESRKHQAPTGAEAFSDAAYSEAELSAGVLADAASDLDGTAEGQASIDAEGSDGQAPTGAQPPMQGGQYDQGAGGYYQGGHYDQGAGGYDQAGQGVHYDHYDQGAGGYYQGNYSSSGNYSQNAGLSYASAYNGYDSRSQRREEQYPYTIKFHFETQDRLNDQEVRAAFEAAREDEGCFGAKPIDPASGCFHDACELYLASITDCMDVHVDYGNDCEAPSPFCKKLHDTFDANRIYMKAKCFP